MVFGRQEAWGRDEEGLAGEEMEVWPRLVKEKSLVAPHTF